MAPRPRVLIETRELPASPDGVPTARVWDVVLEYPNGFAFRYKRPARSRAQAEAWRCRFDAKLREGETPNLTNHWIGRTEEIQGRLTAPPIVRVSRRWEPGLQVIRDGKTSPSLQEPASTARGFRLILVGPATVVKHPETFRSHENAERMQRQLDYGRDLVGHDWELTDLFPCGRTIAYLPSVKIQASSDGGNGSAFRYNYFISDADRYTAARSLRPGAELRVISTAASFSGRLQWNVASLEPIVGCDRQVGLRRTDSKNR